MIFLDEAGLLLTPLIQHTWSPCGQTPVLPHTARRNRKVSVIAALTISPIHRRLNTYFALHAERSIREAEVLGFVQSLTRHVRGNLILVWDRLQAHRSKLVTSYLSTHPRLDFEYLPPYAPDLNPVEQIWNHTKRCELANYCPYDVNQLHTQAPETLAHYKTEQPLLRSFIRHAGLPLRFPWTRK